MYTTGREREKLHAKRYLHSQDHAKYIDAVIDIVHDLIDRKISTIEAMHPIRDAFINGGGGVWEQTGSWLRKLCKDFPDFNSLWIEFSRHQKATIRFRAAAHLREMPNKEFRECFSILINDKSKRVRSKTASDMYDSSDPWVETELENRLKIEEDFEVIDAIKFALTYKKT